MKPPTLVSWSLVALLLAAWPTSAQENGTPPDQIITKDGSKILGTIQTLGGGKLELETTWGGTVTIKFEEVQSLISSKPHVFVQADGSQLKGRPVVTDEGGMQLETELNDVLDLALANVTAINPPPPKPAVTHKGNVTLSGKITDGNTRTKSAKLDAEYVARGERQRLTIGGDWSYAENSGVLSERNASGRIKYDFFVTKRLFAYANSTSEGDDFADLNLRTTLGAGLGYQFLDEEHLQYYEETGISFFDEDFDMAKDDRFASARIAGNMAWTILPKKLSFYHRHEAFFGFEDQDDVFVDTSSGLRLTLIDNFYAAFAINYKWDNTPAPGNRRSDTEYVWGLGYAFDL